MPRKCYNKPNRSRPRRFTPCDAARIAKKATIYSNRESVIATIGLAMNYPALIDAYELLDEGAFGEELGKRLEILFASLNIKNVVDILMQGWFGLFRVVATKVLVWVFKKKAMQLGILISPAVIFVLNEHRLKGASSCGG